MSSRRLSLTVLATICVSGGGLAVTSAPALAGTGYRFDHSFGEFGAGEGQFSEAGAAAVKQTSRDVYVVDQQNNRVERFDAEGKYLGQFNGSGLLPGEGKAAGSGGLPGEKETGQFSSPGGIAVDNSCYFQHESGSECEASDPSNGDVYVADREHNVIDKFTSTGAYIGQLTETSGGEHLSELYGGLAVDSNGVVWAYRTTGEIDSFSNALINAFLPPKVTFAEPGFGGFAVDSHDDLYVKTGSERVAKLDSFGASLIPEIGGEVGFAPASVAVDLAGDDAFIAKGEAVGVFNETASQVATIRLGAEHSARGIGIASGTGTVYVSEFANVAIFSSGPTPPPPNTDAVGNITATSATLNGDLNPEGVSRGVGFYFSYDLGASCTGPGSHTTAPGNATGSTDLPESAAVTGLEPNASYAYCFLASSEFGATSGPTVTFTTPPAKPSIDRQSASKVTLTDATLEAQINPNNEHTSCTFEYGETNTYGRMVPCAPAGFEGYGDTPVSADVGASLAPAETYHYRVIATNATGTTEGRDQTFTTLPFPPTVTVGPVVAASHTATVTFTANAQGGDTQYAVRYGTNPAYTAQAQGDAGHSRNAVTITVSLPELSPSTTYHYNVKVANDGGEEASSDQTFATSSPGAPPSAEEHTATEEATVTVPLVLVQPPTPTLLAAPSITFPQLAARGSSGTNGQTPRSLTRSEKLARALKLCNRDRGKKKRAACRTNARKKYGARANSHPKT
jgi:hypothetical protein